MKKAKEIQDQRSGIGLRIRELRCRQHRRQTELAASCGMSAAQLCNLEKSKNSPSVKTLQRIAKALDVEPYELMQPSQYLQEGDAAANGAPAAAPSKPSAAELTSRISFRFPPEALRKLDRLIKDYLVLEDRCGVSKRSSLPFSLPFTVDEDGAELLAKTIRNLCGIGTAIVFDAVELFEDQGIRVLFVDLPDQFESLSFYDPDNQNFFIFIDRHMNAERQQFRMVFEVANAYLYARNSKLQTENENICRRFAKHFAATFLLPADTVRTSVLQLNISPDRWTYELLLRLKQRFGVSAESFAFRLEELGLLSRDLRADFKERIFNYYNEHSFAEPNPLNRKLSCNGRYEDLKLRAEIEK